MTASLLIPPKARFFTASGAPLAGGKVYTYEAGTTTPKNTYVSYNGSANTNPIILNSAGEANIWLDGNYKIVLKDSADVTQWTVDNVSSTVTTGSLYTTTGVVNAYLLNPSPTLTAYTSGVTYNVIFNISNTGPATINVSNLGTKNLVYPPSTPLSSGNLIAGVIYQIVYDGTNFQVLNPTTVASVNPILITMGLSATPPTGNLVINGSSIGSSTSGATYTGTTYQTLYSYWWNNVSNTYAPVSGGRGASAAADFAANKKLTMPDWSGYTPMGVKAATSITAAAMTAGALTQAAAGTNSLSINPITLTTNELPAHTHGYSYSDMRNSGNLVGSSGGANFGNQVSTTTNSSGSGASFTPTGSSSFTGTPTSILQPSFGIYYYINYQ